MGELLLGEAVAEVLGIAQIGVGHEAVEDALAVLAAYIHL